MAYLTDGKIGINLTDVGSSISEALGSTFTGSDSAQYTYVLADAAIQQYSTVGIAEDFGAAELTTAMAKDGYQIGFAQTALAAGQYGWVLTKGGRPIVRVASLCAADVALYTTSTAGLLDDTATTTLSKIDGAVLLTTNATGSANSTCMVTFPKSGDF